MYNDSTIIHNAFQYIFYVLTHYKSNFINNLIALCTGFAVHLESELITLNNNNEH